MWLPRRVRTSCIAWFLFAIPLASIFGGPLSTWILQLGAHGGFSDWQQLLLVQAAPAVLMGAILPWLLSDSPAQAKWLSEQERTLLLGNVRVLKMSRLCTVIHPRATPPSTSAGYDTLLLFVAIYFAMQFGL